MLAQGGETGGKFSKNGDAGYRASINQLVSQVSFRTPKKWRTDTNITRVKSVGFSVKELEEFIRMVARLDGYKANVLSEANKAIENADEANQVVAQTENDRDTLNSEISGANQQIADLNAHIGRLTEQRQGLMNDITKREKAIWTLDERRSKIQEIITERSTEREGLAKAVAELKQEQRALEDDVNMFPTEIGAFVT